MAFLIGIAQIDITPSSSVYIAGYAARNKPSVGVHDKLFGKAIYIEQNKRNIVLISLDLVGIPGEFVRATRKDIKKETNINNVIISCTHTHSGPNTNNEGFFGRTVNIDHRWLSSLHDKIIDLVKISLLNKEKAKIGIGKINVWNIGKNRRGLFSSDENKVDPELIILKVQDLNNKMKAILLNFTCHATVLDANNYLISADYPGYIYKYLSKAYSDSTILFTNGAAGDINIGYLSADSALGKNMNIRTFDNADRIGKKISEAVLGVIDDIMISDKEELFYIKKSIRLPCRSVMPTEGQLEEKIQKYQKEINVLDDENIKEEKEVQKLYCEILLDKIKSQCCMNGFLHTELDILKINNAWIIAVPGELFCELGLRLKNIFSPSITMILGYSNDQVNYIPTKEAFSNGGYEVETSIFREDVGDILIDEIKLLALLSNL